MFASVLCIHVFVGCWLVGSCRGNNPPIVSFGPPSGHVVFLENKPLGSLLFHINVTDDDSQHITIEIDTSNQDTVAYVDLGNVTRVGNTWSRPVILKKTLDRDRNPSQRVLLFKVADEQSPLYGKVTLVIRDVNDNPPEFEYLPYRIQVNESHPIGVKVFNVSARDVDDGPGGAVQYSMAAHAQGADDIYNRTFAIRNSNFGDIFLELELDYEKRNYYQFMVYAVDIGNPPCPGARCLCNNVLEKSVNCDGDPAPFTVIVEDVQDTPPFFSNLPYITSVSEDKAVGTSVFQVTALDGDRGIPNEVLYRFANDSGSHPFRINATGTISVASQLDADQPFGKIYALTVIAYENTKPNEIQLGNTSASTRVSISVTDVNDNAPEFERTYYTATVQENTPQGVPLSMNIPIQVTDKDQTQNSEFNLTVEMMEDDLFFVFDTLPAAGSVIHSTTTVIVRVNNTSVLDYEKRNNITFKLVATETSTPESHSNFTTVTVTLTDMNDNVPVFEPGTPTVVNVTEHADNGTLVATFTATDADSGNYGEVSYSLEDDLDGKFAMDPTSGNLTVAGDVDRESSRSHSLVVKATDNMAGIEANRRTARMNVHVNVLDKNDNPPQFSPHPLSVAVQENTPSNTTLMTLTATDEDEGVNGNVVYKVLGITSDPASSYSADLFSVHRHTGVVFVNSSLIGHSGSHNVTFVAHDSAPVQMNATTHVLIQVVDVNLNKPVFVDPDESLIDATLGIIPNVSIYEEEFYDTEIKILQAEDKDTGNNGLVYYFLEPDLAQNWQSFKIDRRTGNLTNILRLDREEHASFQISVKAEDQGSPNTLSSVIPLKIILIDIDDNEPRFPHRSRYHLDVGEETKDVMVGNVSVAVDDDQDPENQIKCYYLYGGDMLGAFFLNKTSGELLLLRPLDRDVTPSLDLVVKVTRNCSLPEDHFYVNSNNAFNSSDVSLLDVLLRVQDINDNPPVLEDALSVGQLYDVQIGTVVIDLAQYTTDEDTNLHSQNKFRLLNTALKGEMPADMLSPPPFLVNVSGSVVTNRLFQANLLGFFILTVQAYDDDNHTDTGDLKIYLVSDLQRIKLVFSKLPDEVREIRGELATQLSDALGFNVIADKIATHINSGGQPEATMTDVYIHARYNTTEDGHTVGDIVPISVLERAFDYNTRVREIFEAFGVRNVLRVLTQEPKEEDNLLRAFIIVAVVLGLICLALMVVLINTIRRYHRRLKAATTSAYVSEKQAPDVYVPPGTNKYFAAENPLFGRDVKIIDPDRLSNDSLDNNAVDSAHSADGKEKEEEQEMYLQLFEENGLGAGMHVNHLAMVLHEYDREQQEEQPDNSAPSSPVPSSRRQSDANWYKTSSSSTNGHVKSDSGYNEQGSMERADDFQYTDI